jgi:hypothetical protein
MDWQAIRQQHPASWVLVEAFNAYTEAGQRVIPHLVLIAAFGDDWHEGWERYKALHHADRRREYYLLHTNRAELDIGVIDVFGRVVNS